MSDVRDLVKQAIIAEIDRQAQDEKRCGPYFDPDQGIIDGTVDLDRIADAVVAALAALEGRVIELLVRTDDIVIKGNTYTYTPESDDAPP